jgi:integrase
MVRKVKGSWWVDFQVHGKRYRLRSPDNHREGAVAYEQALRRKLADGEEVSRASLVAAAKESPRLVDFADRWLNEYVATNLKPSTRRTYEQRLRLNLLPTVGKQRLNEITSHDVELLKMKLLKDGGRPSTVNKALSVLRKCLETAIEWELPAKLPRIRWMREPPPQSDFLTVAEADALLRAVQTEPWSLMVLCALRTGMRLGELFGLRWEDLDFERRQLCVRRSVNRGFETSPKNNRVRYIPLASDLLAELARRRKANGYVFTKNEERVTASAAWNALNRAILRARLRPIGWHVLRHTFASQLAADGVSLFMIQWLLGHSDQKMTQRYAHLAPSALHGTVERLVELRRALPTSDVSRASPDGEQATNALPALPPRVETIPIIQRQTTA